MVEAERDAGELLVLLTKYNVARPGQADRPGLERRWLDRRLALFDEWPLPSVRAQARRPDRWLVFVDADTDPSYLRALADRLDGFGTLVPVDGALSDVRIGESVAATVETGTRRLLTVRLDSDDAIAADYLRRMQAAAIGWRGFIHAPLGYRVCGDRVLRARERSGPFLGFVEAPGAGRPRTVFQMPHSEAASRGPVRELAGRPAWVQVVHGGNLANAFTGWPAAGAALVSDMGLDSLRGRKLDGRLGLRERAGAMVGQVRQELSWQARRLARAVRAEGAAS